ncbi:MAG: CDP-glycerol glycerophosphotransferase family protein [Selenomonadaceae bacterium]|nr:CDP-glycerol glycerophosphotransferase family protein [Selenomonadaceae bacterium]
MRRQIQKQLLIKIKHIYHNIESILIEDLLLQLKEMQNIFKSELSEKRYPLYGEILDGLVLAATQISNNANSAERSQVTTLIKELLNYIFAELMKETEIKKDVVFIPYKASMWDSLESIWIAANEDREHCNAYVMPIPYAERKEDQTVAKWHYEANLFPKYVPITDWEKIDLEKMHPDVIFIHNPYDNCNALTSVGSEYYSGELKNYTDKLVYVPYFVSHDIKPGDEDIEEYMAHLVTTKGVLNSDLVVVQSEDLRQVYINVLIRHTNQKDRRYWEQHIVGLGSPKYDKLLATKKEEIDIPQEWLKIIRKPDKSWKKIILYNTGLQSMIDWKEKMVDKIDEIIQTFKAHKDEIALIWRPHPLVAAFTYGLAPELNDRYQAIVNTYKQEGWGIYDDTSNFYRALVLSDAFFGDHSSIIFLYKTTGKPIFFNSPIINEAITKGD